MSDFHAFQKGGDTFLFFARSARLYELSEAAAGMLTELSDRGSGRDLCYPGQGFPLQNPPPTPALYGEVRDLLQKELSVPLPAPSGKETPADYSCRTFSIYLAQSCNMSCCYCWNRGGSFGNAPLLMGQREARLVAELIASVAAESKAQRIYVNFYGGEPLLNFEALQTITLQLLREEKRLGKKFHFTIDTNGWFLEGEAADFLAGHFSLIGVSVDGREEVHDRQRPGECGEGTWRRIVNNLARFPNRKILGVRATLTTSSDSYLKTFRQLLTLGINRIQLEYCHEPGYHDDPAYEELIVPQERQLAELEEFIDAYVATISGYRDTGAIPLVPTLMDNVTRIRRGNRFTRPCGAGINTLAINSRGELFPCIAFADRAPFNMGSVGEKRPLPLHHTLEGFDVDQQEECSACWLRYDCAGGCYATHYEMTGHPRHPHPEYCRNMRAKGELQLYAMARMIKHCPWHLESPSA